MPMGNERFLLVAVDHGASMALKPLIEYEDFVYLEPSKESLSVSYWQDYFEGQPWSALIVGTSDSDRGKSIEAAAHEAAIHHGLATVAIEDYPGNYNASGNRHVDVLVVDSEFSRNLYQERLGDRCPEIWICKPIRYDPLRISAQECRTKNQNICKKRETGHFNVLWAGQPETDDGVMTIERLLPSLVRQNTKLLFKAHPRDAGYREQVYQRKFSERGVDYVDVTHCSLNECMELTPDLILTQFSSLAIEAGYFGIPAIHVLYDDIGAKRLYTKKGYRIPPWCLANAAFLITSIEQQDEVLRRALTDDRERKEVLDKFNRYFDVSSVHAPYLAEKIRRRFEVENIK